MSIYLYLSTSIYLCMSMCICLCMSMFMCVCVGVEGGWDISAAPLSTSLSARIGRLNDIQIYGYVYKFSIVYR